MTGWAVGRRFPWRGARLAPQREREWIRRFGGPPGFVRVQVHTIDCLFIGDLFCPISVPESAGCALLTLGATLSIVKGGKKPCSPRWQTDALSGGSVVSYSPYLPYRRLPMYCGFYDSLPRSWGAGRGDTIYRRKSLPLYSPGETLNLFQDW